MRRDLSGLEAEFKLLGIQKGDVLYFSSDVKTLLFSAMSGSGGNHSEVIYNTLNELVDLLQELVGKTGTILFPIFSWSFCRGGGFDIRRTPGEVGTLPNWVLKNRKDFQRTKHPMYSFMVWGRDADRLTNMDNQDAWSEASPFMYMRNINAKQVLFNIEAYEGLTFGHYVEQSVKVPYRHPKYFFGEYKDMNGASEIRSYSMYVRDLQCECDCGIHNEFLIKNGKAVQSVWQKNIITVARLGDCYNLLAEDMLNNNGKNTLIFHNGYSLDWKQEYDTKYEISDLGKLIL